jgi:hypothetical protein
MSRDGTLSASEERIARRVAELLDGSPPDRSLMATRDVAEWLGIEPETVRELADQLGAWRLPSEGGKGRLRFDRAEVERRLRPPDEGAKATKPRRPPSRSSSPVALLPVADR